MEAGDITLDEFEERLRGLLKGEFSHLILSLNNLSGSNHLTVAQGVEHDFADPQWVSAEERRRAIELNRWWELQWYPETPIGFHVISASSLRAIVKYLEERSEGGE